MSDLSNNLNAARERLGFALRDAGTMVAFLGRAMTVIAFPAESHADLAFESVEEALELYEAIRSNLTSARDSLLDEVRSHRKPSPDRPPTGGPEPPA